MNEHTDLLICPLNREQVHILARDAAHLERIFTGRKDRFVQLGGMVQRKFAGQGIIGADGERY
jgi:hypothetical protein